MRTNLKRLVMTIVATLLVALSYQFFEQFDMMNQIFVKTSQTNKRLYMQQKTLQMEQSFTPLHKQTKVIQSLPSSQMKVPKDKKIVQSKQHSPEEISDGALENLGHNMITIAPSESSTIQKAIQQKHFDFMFNRNQSDSDIRFCGHPTTSQNERNKKLKKLSEKVQTMIYRSQNPEDCEGARYFMIPPTMNGQGSQIHRLMVALSMAMYSNKVLLMDDQRWKAKFSGKGWNEFYQPLSKCNRTRPKGSFSQKEIVMLEAAPNKKLNWDGVASIPVDIAQELAILHTRPNLWWNAQLVGYITRLNSTLEQKFRENFEIRQNTAFNVGLHVRRTDKQKVAIYQPLAKYINYTEMYLEARGISNSAHIYVASDDATIPATFAERYPMHQFINLPLEEDRKSSAGLISLMSDLYMLLQSDYIVCTLSSNICRYAYEMMQFLHGDVSNCLYSLDTQYCTGLNYNQYRIVTQDYVISIPLKPYQNTSQNSSYKKKDIVNLIKDAVFHCYVKLPIERYSYSIVHDTVQVTLAEKGDIIFFKKYLKNDLHNEYEFGTNLRTNQIICYPSSHVVDYILVR